jgi:hypothetical protein
VTSLFVAFSIKKVMVSFSHQSGLNPAFRGKGLHLNKITLFVPATLPSGPPNAARGLKNSPKLVHLYPSLQHSPIDKRWRPLTAVST